MPIDPNDVDAFFDSGESLDQYVDDVQEELARTYELGAIRQGLPKSQAQLRATEYAKQHAAELIEGLDNTTRDTIKDLVSKTISDGESLQTLKKWITESGAFSKDRAYTIARTETATAHGQGSHEAAKMMGQDEKSWERNETEPDDECQDNEDAGWIDIDDTFPSGDDTIPAHPNCCLGHTLVLAEGVLASSDRWFDGEIVILRTASGKELSVTPNHPVLSDHGWIAAGLLKEGDNVVCSKGAEWDSTSVNQDHEHVPTSIKKVAESVGGPRSMPSSEVPVSPEDFHGDGASSQVAVVRTNRLLADGFNASDPQQGRKIQLSGRDIGLEPLDSLGMSQLGLAGNDSALSSSVSRSTLGKTLFRSHAIPEEPDGLTLSSGDDTVSSKGISDSLVAHSVLLAEGIHGLSCEVGLDEIIQVGREPFSGHVYNLQTESSYLFTESILSHNCECDVVYRTAGLHEDEESDDEPTGDEETDNQDDEESNSFDWRSIFAEIIEPDPWVRAFKEALVQDRSTPNQCAKHDWILNNQNATLRCRNCGQVVPL